MSKKYKATVISLFLIPTAITILAFGYIFDIKNQELQSNKMLIFSGSITQSASSLIHTIQIERGLSAGFLASKDANKEKLVKQQKITDKFYREFLLLKKKDEIDFANLIQDQKLFLQIQTEMDKIKTIRKNVLSHSISFNDEIKYYSNINTKLLNLIHNLAVFDTKNSYEGILIYDIETLKENLGLERAYIYNQLLSKKPDEMKFKEIIKLIITQDIIRKKLLLDATPQTKEFYQNYIDTNSLKEMRDFRYKFLSQQLNSSDAERWFKLSTDFIDRHEAVSINILDLYLKNIEQNYDKAQNIIYIITIFFALSIILTIILLFTLNNLFNRSKKNKSN